MRNNAKQIREKTGMSQEQLGEALGHHYTTINRMENKPALSPKWVVKLAKFFKVPESALIGSSDPGTPPASDVPVYGLAAGSVTGAFTLTSEAVEWVRRPPGLTGARDAYALFVTGSSMEPRFFPGDVVYVAPHRPVRRGDVVVIQQRDHEQSGTQVWLKVFEKKDEKFVHATQYNPPAEVKFPHASVVTMQRVMTMNELLGL